MPTKVKHKDALFLTGRFNTLGDAIAAIPKTCRVASTEEFDSVYREMTIPKDKLSEYTEYKKRQIYVGYTKEFLPEGNIPFYKVVEREVLGIPDKEGNWDIPC